MRFIVDEASLECDDLESGVVRESLRGWRACWPRFARSKLSSSGL